MGSVGGSGGGGGKTIETRRWRWSFGPSWLAIHATKREDGDIPGRVEPFPDVPPVTPGTLCALVWVARCRPLEVGDKDRALVYQDGLWAFELEHLFRLAPVPWKGPQKIGYVDRDVVVNALADAALR